MSRENIQKAYDKGEYSKAKTLCIRLQEELEEKSKTQIALVDVRFTLSTICEAMQQADEAILNLKCCIVLCNLNAHSGGHFFLPNIHLSLAELLIKKTQYQDAITHLKKAREFFKERQSYDDAAIAAVNIGKLYYIHQNDARTASQYFQEVKALKKRILDTIYASAIYFLAKIAHESGKDAETLALCKEGTATPQSARKNPPTEEQVGIFILMGLYYLQKNNLKTALTCYQNASKWLQKHFLTTADVVLKAYHTMGITLYNHKHTDQAIDYLKPLNDYPLQHLPDDVKKIYRDARLALSIVTFYKKDYHFSKEILSKIIDMFSDPEFKFTCYFYLGRIAEAQKKLSTLKKNWRLAFNELIQIRRPLRIDVGIQFLPGWPTETTVLRFSEIILSYFAQQKWYKDALPMLTKLDTMTDIKVQSLTFIRDCTDIYQHCGKHTEAKMLYELLIAKIKSFPIKSRLEIFLSYLSNSTQYEIDTRAMNTIYQRFKEAVIHVLAIKNNHPVLLQLIHTIFFSLKSKGYKPSADLTEKQAIHYARRYYLLYDNLVKALSLPHAPEIHTFILTLVYQLLWYRGNKLFVLQLAMMHDHYHPTVCTTKSLAAKAPTCLVESPCFTRIMPIPFLRFMDLPEPIKFICLTLATMHPQCFWIVGGYIRDKLLGKAPRDFDIVTTLPFHTLQTLFADFKPIANDYHKHIELHPGDIACDITSITHSLTEDSLKRDFSLNAFYWDPINNHVIDAQAAISSIGQKTIQLIGEPDKRLASSPIILLRALRLSIQLGFALEHTLNHYISQNGENVIYRINMDKLEKELKKSITSHSMRRKTKKCLKKYGLFSAVSKRAPELLQPAKSNLQAHATGTL